MGSNKHFSEYCIPFLLDKLKSILNEVKIQTFEGLRYCLEKYGREKIFKLIPEILIELKTEILKNNDDKVFFECLYTIQKISTIVYEKNDDNSDEKKEKNLKILENIINPVLKELQSPESKFISILSKMLKSSLLLNNYGCQEISNYIINSIDIVFESFKSTQKRGGTLEVFSDILDAYIENKMEIEDKLLKIILNIVDSCSKDSNLINFSIILYSKIVIFKKDFINYEKIFDFFILNLFNNDFSETTINSLIFISTINNNLIKSNIIEILLYLLLINNNNKKNNNEKLINNNENFKKFIKNNIEFIKNISNNENEIFNIILKLSKFNDINNILIIILNILNIEKFNNNQTFLNLIKALFQNNINEINNELILKIIFDFSNILIFEINENKVILNENILNELNDIINFLFKNIKNNEIQLNLFNNILQNFEKNNLKLFNILDNENNNLNNTLILQLFSIYSPIFFTINKDNIQKINNLNEIEQFLFKFSNINNLELKYFQNLSIKSLSSIYNKNKNINEKNIENIINFLINKIENYNEKLLENEKYFIYNYINNLTWITKAFVMKGLYKFSDKIINLYCNYLFTKDSNFCKIISDAINTLLFDYENILNKSTSSNIQNFYKQRLFSLFINSLLEKIKKNDNSNELPLLLTITSLIKNVDSIIILNEIQRVFPLIKKSLNSKDSEICSSSLSTLYILIKNSKEEMINHLHTIIPILLNLTCFKNSINVRLTSLNCLIELNTYNYNEIFRFKNDIINGLEKVLDDKKRNVRNLAVNCKNLWILMENNN
jgi:hypothetical protein